jgi:hypothetical protein
MPRTTGSGTRPRRRLGGQVRAALAQLGHEQPQLPQPSSAEQRSKIRLAFQARARRVDQRLVRKAPGRLEGPTLQRVRPRAAAQARNSVARRVLPMPASPRMTTAWGRPRAAAWKRSARAANSSSRPTSSPSRGPGTGRSVPGCSGSRGELARSRTASAVVCGSGRTPSSRSSTAQQVAYAARAPVWSPTAVRSSINRRWARSSSGFSPSQRMTASIAAALSPVSARSADNWSRTASIR